MTKLEMIKEIVERSGEKPLTKKEIKYVIKKRKLKDFKDVYDMIGKCRGKYKWDLAYLFIVKK